VLANLDHAELRHALMFKVFDMYLGNPPRDWSADLLALYAGIRAQGDSAQRRFESRRVAGTQPTIPLERYAGSYADSLVGTMAVTVDAGKLRLRSSSKRAGTLEHWQYDTFRVRWDDAWQGTSLVTFTIGVNGSPSAVEVLGRSLSRVDRQSTDSSDR
jgi:Domain of unknown function (DUF3471)